MKRETRKALKHCEDNGAKCLLAEAQVVDALATDAEVKRLKKALRVAERYVPSGPDLRIVRAALKPQVTRERKRR